jgi:hypothetical protein
MIISRNDKGIVSSLHLTFNYFFPFFKEISFSSALKDGKRIKRIGIMRMAAIIINILGSPISELSKIHMVSIPLTTELKTIQRINIVPAFFIFNFFIILLNPTGLILIRIKYLPV